MLLECLHFMHAALFQPAGQLPGLTSQAGLQVMVLAQQLHPDALKRSSGGALLSDVCALLDGQHEGSRGLPPSGPTVLRATAAVSAMFARVDWARLRRSTAGVPDMLQALPDGCMMLKDRRTQAWLHHATLHITTLCHHPVHASLLPGAVPLLYMVNLLSPGACVQARPIRLRSWPTGGAA